TAMTDTGTFSTLTSVAVMQPARADVVIRAAEVNYAYGSGETRTQVLFDNDLSSATERDQVELRKNIGFIFQQHNLFSSLTAIENVRMATALRRDSVQEMNNRCIEILGKLGLGERMNHLPAELSGGQKQRVAIARALVNQPALVLA